MQWSERPAAVRLALECALALLAVAAVRRLPPTPQAPLYHLFADRRPLLGIPR